MAYYLVPAAYTPEGWANLVKNPQNRGEAVRPVVEGLGGSRSPRMPTETLFVAASTNAE